jgi:hypothetical protein
MEAWLEEKMTVQRKRGVNLWEMKTKLRANNEKFEVLQGTSLSDEFREEMKTSKEKMTNKMVSNLKEMKARHEIMEEMRAW